MTQWHIQIYPSALLPLWHGISWESDRMLLTELAIPMGLLLTVGPLANVEIDGSRVPPKAISTSFGGCLGNKQKTVVTPCEGVADPGSKSRSKSGRKCQVKIIIWGRKKQKWKRKKKSFWKSTPHQWESGSRILAVCSSPCLSALGLLLFFWLKIFRVCSSFLFFVFSSNYIPVHVARGLKAPCEGAGRAGFNAEAEEKQRTWAVEEAMCSGESLSSVVMQQTGRLDCENRVRGILKSLGLDPFSILSMGGRRYSFVFCFF